MATKKKIIQTTQKKARKYVKPPIEETAAVNMNKQSLNSIIKYAEKNGINDAVNYYINNLALYDILNNMVSDFQSLTDVELTEIGVPSGRLEAWVKRAQKMAQAIEKFQLSLGGTLRRAVRAEIGRHSSVLRNAAKLERMKAKRKKLDEEIAMLEAGQDPDAEE